MMRGIILILAAWLVCTAGGVRRGDGVASSRGREALILFWNLENYFDPADDPNPADDEFTRHGEKRWSYARSRRKAQAVAKTLAAVAAQYGDFPVLAAFAEVENRRVLARYLGKK